MDLEAAAYLVLVAILWGLTNPLMKKGAIGIEEVKASNGLRKFFAELKFLVKNLKYLIPFAVNQLGSLIYLRALQHVDLSLTVVISNSLTFIFTALMGRYLGEEKLNKKSILGIIFVLSGTTLCCLDKIQLSQDIHEEL